MHLPELIFSAELAMPLLFPILLGASVKNARQAAIGALLYASIIVALGAAKHWPALAIAEQCLINTAALFAAFGLKTFRSRNKPKTGELTAQTRENYIIQNDSSFRLYHLNNLIWLGFAPSMLAAHKHAHTQPASAALLIVTAFFALVTLLTMMRGLDFKAKGKLLSATDAKFQDRPKQKSFLQRAIDTCNWALPMSISLSCLGILMTAFAAFSYGVSS